MPKPDVPEWAIETAREINLTLPYAHVQGAIARALVAAERRGIERAVGVANSAADKWQQHRDVNVGLGIYGPLCAREIATAIRKLGASE